MKEDASNGIDPQEGLAYRVAYLVMGFIKKNQTEAEQQELDEWICSSRENEALFEELIDEKNLAGWEEWKAQLPLERRYRSAKAKIKKASRYRRMTLRLAAPWLAAAAILVLILASWLLLQKNKTEKTTTSIAATGLPVKNDIAPGSNRATLQLANGVVLILDKLQQGNISRQAGTDIIKNDSALLTYRSATDAIATEKPTFNTLSTPKGGQFKLVLADGTKVWLNAASSLTYPTAFAGSDRKVTLIGEAYFEVAKDPAHPFYVTTNGAAIRVLGTHFNVHAYEDEPVIKVSLAEGSVKVASSGTAAFARNQQNEKLLAPGQQARIDAAGSIKTVTADLEADLAWKNGQFLFKQASIKELMVQVARWYDASIDYKANITDHFNADIPRSVPVSKLLELLEQTESVHFTVESINGAKKITVLK